MTLIVDPRSMPRVTVELHADVAVGNDLWQATTEDFGPGGCLLVSRRSLLAAAAGRLLLRTPRLRDSLIVEGNVVWWRAGRAGFAFRTSQVSHAASWFRRILDGAPCLRFEVEQSRRQLHFKDRLFAGPMADAAGTARPFDEMLVLCSFSEGCSVGTLARRVALPAERFSRAVFALIHAGLLTPSPHRAGNETAPGVSPWLCSSSFSASPRDLAG